MKILFTGFTPFGGETVNPSWEAVRQMADRLGDIIVLKQNIPTAFGEAAKEVAGAVRRYEPDAVICVGESGGRARIEIEKVAVNYRNASIPDNLGACPQDEPVCAGGPAAYFATVPVRKIAADICAQGIPACVSYSAGTYVCNDTFYSLMRLIDVEGLSVKGGFIHVPYLPEQAVGKGAGTPSMALPLIVKALETAAAAVFAD